MCKLSIAKNKNIDKQILNFENKKINTNQANINVVTKIDKKMEIQDDVDNNFYKGIEILFITYVSDNTAFITFTKREKNNITN